MPADGLDLGTGWRARLAGFVWRLLAPLFQRQQTFNSTLVDHVNRNVPVHRATQEALAHTIQALREHLDGLSTLQSSLIVYLQQLTPYVDTKDRECSGLLRRASEDTGVLLDVYKERLDQAIDELRGRITRVDGFAGGLSGVSDELLKRWESMVARERRFDAKVSALTSAHDELRTTTGVLQNASVTLRNQLERLLTAEAGSTVSRPAPRDSPPGAPASAPSSDVGYAYVGFEDQFRGSQEEIREAVADYIPFFEGTADVLDVGCGRGEFLDLLRSHGISSRGVDINAGMVEVCRERGLEVEHGDAVSLLGGLPSGALGGLFAAQVVEHLQPDYLLRLLEVAHDKLRPGSRIVLETINPACWFAFFESYIRDITHVRPIHPDTLKYLLVANGFQQVDVRYRAPYPEHDKLQPVPLPAESTRLEPGLQAAADMAETFNANAKKLNQLLFTHLDYAVIGTRP